MPGRPARRRADLAPPETAMVLPFGRGPAAASALRPGMPRRGPAHINRNRISVSNYRCVTVLTRVTSNYRLSVRPVRLVALIASRSPVASLKL